MKINVAAVGLAHPFEVGYDQAPALLNQTAEMLAAIFLSKVVLPALGGLTIIAR